MLTYPGPMGGDSALVLIGEALRRQWAASGGWMTWNLMLALTPWILAVGLFRPSRRPRWQWFVLAAGWLLLIPNAAYVLTDVVHLPAAVRREPSDPLVMLVVFPLYATFFTVGFFAYCDALRRLGRHVTHLGWVRRGWTIEVAVHAVSAVAIYLGRIHRLNSWDMARDPLAVAGRILVGATRPVAVGGIAIMFVALSAGHLLTRPILDAVAARAAGLAARLRA